MIVPCDLSATELRRLIGARALSPVELLDSCLARIARVNPAVNAVGRRLSPDQLAAPDLGVLLDELSASMRRNGSPDCRFASPLDA